jgi:threonine/homoserine/homoserine lactone efflux protein
MATLTFLATVLGISLTGAMSPGAVTAAAISMGSRDRFAGTRMALGHAIIEIPLMVLLLFGAAQFLQRPPVEIAIGLAGGVFLIIMAVGMAKDLKRSGDVDMGFVRGGPLMTGIVLTGANPYFLIWWATIGLALIDGAAKLGAAGFALMAVAHWSCDLAWLTILSWASFKGTSVLSPSRRRIVLGFCALALFGFGLLFIGDKSAKLCSLAMRPAQPAGGASGAATMSVVPCGAVSAAAQTSLSVRAASDCL